MKKILTIALTALIVASCGNRQTGGADGEEAEFTVDSLTFSEEDSKGKVLLEFDFPHEKGTPLSDSIRLHISNMLGGTYQGDKNDNSAMLQYYGKGLMAQFNTDNDGGLQWESTTSFKLLHQTSRYVTFSIDTYEFSGGAHGLGASFLSTYHRKNGRTFGSDLLKDTASDAFCQLLKEGVKSYLADFDKSAASMDDEQLSSQLLLPEGVSVNRLPLPALEPALTPSGVSFTYTPYEIAPYVAGCPTFTIAYEKIRPFLTDEALKWIE